MTKLFSISTILILLFSGFSYSQKTSENDYTLTIKKGKVTKENKQTFWVIPTTFTNNSKDTLRYYSMSCSWQDFYSVDNKKLKIEIAECDKNVPTILTLAPKQSKTVEIRLLISQTIYASEIKFKIGFNLMKVSKTQKPFDFDFKKEHKKENIIWSNLITM